MFEVNSVGATYIVNEPSNATVTVQGIVYRVIPHSSQTPLSANFAYQLGGRWNGAGSYPVLYTCGSVAGVMGFLNSQVATYGLPVSEWQPEYQPDLLVLSVTASFADVATNSGLTFYGLPTSYPVGFSGQDAWSTTQPIGAAIHAAGWPGLVTRSATMSDWSGPMATWAEIAIFTDQAQEPRLVERIDYRDWFFR